MKKQALALFASMVLIGCTTYHGIKPISPGTTGETTNALPTFTWNPSETQGVKYDLIVYDLVWKRTVGFNYVPVAGETIYYREGLDRCEHTMETALTRGKDYLWSVRVRNGDTVGPWALYDFNAYYVFGYIIQRNHLFSLKIVDPNAPKTDGPEK